MLVGASTDEASGPYTRGNEMISDRCPLCNRLFKWNAEQDVYCDANEIAIGEKDDIDVVAYLCPDDGGIIGLVVTDTKFGQQVYVPSKKTL
jgi:hypothetical protein